MKAQRLVESKSDWQRGSAVKCERKWFYSNKLVESKRWKSIRIFIEIRVAVETCLPLPGFHLFSLTHRFSASLFCYHRLLLALTSSSWFPCSLQLLLILIGSVRLSPVLFGHLLTTKRYIDLNSLSAALLSLTHTVAILDPIMKFLV